MVRPKLVPPRGILHLRLQAAEPGYGRFWPCAELEPFVEHFWTVAWDVPEPVIRETLPHPSVHLVFEAGRGHVVGVPRGRFTRTLVGRGRVLGTKFRPGGFRAFLDVPVATLTGRMLPIESVFGPASADVVARASAEDEPAAAFATVQEFLSSRSPRPNADAALAGRIAERVAEERAITRVEPLAHEFGLGARALQRLFREYVGVTPKWVIQRYRLHEAAERAAAGTVQDWAALAFDLGYADQAHFIRDFKRLIGRTPRDYTAGFQRD